MRERMDVTCCACGCTGSVRRDRQQAGHQLRGRPCVLEADCGQRGDGR